MNTQCPQLRRKKPSWSQPACNISRASFGFSEELAAPASEKAAAELFMPPSSSGETAPFLSPPAASKNVHSPTRPDLRAVSGLAVTSWRGCPPPEPLRSPPSGSVGGRADGQGGRGYWQVPWFQQGDLKAQAAQEGRLPTAPAAKKVTNTLRARGFLSHTPPAPPKQTQPPTKSQSAENRPRSSCHFRREDESRLQDASCSLSASGEVLVTTRLPPRVRWGRRRSLSVCACVELTGIETGRFGAEDIFALVVFLKHRNIRWLLQRV